MFHKTAGCFSCGFFFYTGFMCSMLSGIKISFEHGYTS